MAWTLLSLTFEKCAFEPFFQERIDQTNKYTTLSMLQTNKYTIFSMYLTMIIMKSSIKEQQPNDEAICLSYNGNACNFAKISHCRRSIQKIFNCFFQCDDMNEQHWTSFKKKRNTHRRHCFAINQRAIPKLIEKKDRDKRLIKNWRLISLLNADTKVLSKAI